MCDVGSSAVLFFLLEVWVCFIIILILMLSLDSLSLVSVKGKSEVSGRGEESM